MSIKYMELSFTCLGKVFSKLIWILGQLELVLLRYVYFEAMLSVFQSSFVVASLWFYQDLLLNSEYFTISYDVLQNDYVITKMMK